jgi:hypothetical protein
MPEATVDENDFVKRSKNQVGFSWQILRLKAITVAETPADFANDHFRLGIG